MWPREKKIYQLHDELRISWPIFTIARRYTPHSLHNLFVFSFLKFWRIKTQQEWVFVIISRKIIHHFVHICVNMNRNVG